MKEAICTIAYQPIDVLKASFKNLAEKSSGQVPVHVLDNRFPGQNEQEIYKLCLDYGYIYHTFEMNLGLHNGFNLLMREVAGDTPLSQCNFILFDADSVMDTQDFDLKMLEILQVKPELGWLSAHNDHSWSELEASKGFEDEVILGHSLRIVKQPCINSVSAWKGTFLQACGGLFEPHLYYGALEVAMFKRLLYTGFQWAFTPEVHELARHHLPVPIDEHYAEYKRNHVGGGLNHAYEGQK